MGYGGCDTEMTALVTLNTTQFPNGLEIDVYVNDSDEYEIRSGGLIYGYNLLSLPSSLFTNEVSHILIQPKSQDEPCDVQIFNKPEFSGFNLSFPYPMTPGITNTIVASVTAGYGLIFSFTISTLIEGSQELQLIIVTKPCNMTALEVSVKFVPTIAEYIVDAAVFMDSRTSGITLRIMSGNSIPDSVIEFGPNCTNHSGYFHPGDTVNVVLKAIDSAHSFRSSQPNCTINWGDGTILDEVDLTMQKTNVTSILYSRNHIYKALGNYSLHLRCFNPINEVNGSLEVMIQSPANFADAYLQNTLLPFSSIINEAKGVLIITHQYLTEDYPELSISVNFGLPNSEKYINFTYSLQPLEQLYTQKGTYILSVIFEAFGFIKEVKMTLQVGVFDFYIINRPSVVRAYNEIEFQLVRYTKSETWNLEVNFDPEIQTKTFPDGTDKLYVPYTYKTIGTKKAKATLEVNSTKEVVIFEFTVLISCIGNTNLFGNLYRNETTPLSAMLSNLPTIAGWIERSPLCRTNETFIFTWQLSIKKENAPVYVWDPISLSQPRSISITLKQFIHKSGLYHIILMVTSVNDNHTVMDQMFLEVREPSIVADIIGSAFTQHSIGKHLILDAESVSNNPINFTPENSGLSFSWACFMLKSDFDIQEVTQPYYENHKYTHNIPCSLQLPAMGKINVTTVNFNNGDFVLFEVTASKNERKDTAVKVVEMLQAQLPVIFIKCKWNCGAKLVAEDRTVFTARIECPECNSHDIYYADHLWSLSKIDVNTGQYIKVPWNKKIISDPQNKSFDSEGGWWEPGTTYKLTVVIKVGSLSAATTYKVFYTNFEPYNGTCSVKPLEGEAGVTDFLFVFPDWKDELDRSARNIVLDAGAVLYYEVQQRAAADTPAIYYGVETSSSNNVLPACGTDNNYCNVDITIIDPFSGKTTCTVSLKVTLPVNITANGNKEQNSQTVINNIDKIREDMKHAIQIGNSIKIAQFAAVYSTVLSSMDASASVQKDVTFFTAANITSEKALPFLLDPKTEFDPIRNSLSLANQQLVFDIGGALELDTSENLYHLSVYAKSLTAVTSNENLLTGQTLQDSVILASKLTDKLSAQTQRFHTMSEPENYFNGIVQLLNNIIKISAFDMKILEPDTSLLKDTDLSRSETTYIAALMAKRRSYNIASIQQHTHEIVKHIKSIWSALLNSSRQFEHYNGSYEFKAKTFSAVVQKTTRENILQKNNAATSSHLLNSFSVTDVEVEGNFSDIHIEVLKSKNIFTQGSHSKFITSDIYISSVSSDSGTQFTMKSPSITHDIGVEDCFIGKNVHLIKPKFLNEDAALMFYHSFNYLDTNTRICITIKQTSVSALHYRMYVKSGSEPTDINYDYRVTLSIETVQNCRETCIPSKKLISVGHVFIGLRPLIDPSIVAEKGKRKREAVVDSLDADYIFGIRGIACYSWDEKLVDWNANRCNFSRGNKTVTCTCSDSSELISALAFNFAPNAIHFPKVFSKFDIKNQGEVIGLLLSVYFIMILTGCWAHYKDRKGIFQWGVFPLVDNYADEDYFYLITVHTGLRKSAGTKSKASFCLSGEINETGVRQLTDGIREGFPTASMLHFVMACPKSLGSLQCLRIWHDNSGKGSDASWYLDRVDVTDIQTGETYCFLCGEWLTPENNTIDKVIEASNVKDLQSLKNMLFFNTKKHVTDDHIWMSVIIRPNWSRFSRVDRVGCCLAFLLLAMITSAMFYKGAPGNDRQKPPSDLQIGPVRLSLQQLYNSFISAVVTAIPLTAIVMIFRRARTIPRKEHRSCCGRSKKKDDAMPRNSCCAKIHWMEKLERQLLELEKILLIKPDAEDINNAWPHFWRYATWVLVVAVTIICSFFVILYTMEWGRDVTHEWVSSFFLAFLQSMFVVDPFKVILISFLLSVFIRKTTVKGVNELDLKQILQVNREHGIKNKSDPPRESVSFLSTHSEEELKAITRKRKIHTMIRNTLWELTIHCIFLLIICSFCYATRSTHDYQLYKQIYSDLVGDKDKGFSFVSSKLQYFDWLENMFIPWIFPEKDANGQPLKSEERQFTSVWNLYHLGAPRLRQVRMKKGDCMNNLLSTKPCIDEYNIFQEETADYCLGWSKTPCPQTDSLHVTAGAWFHRSAQSILGPPITGEYNTYGGGGYILNVDINLLVARAVIQEMKKYLWIDQQTRAVFLEMTIYCPDVSRFVYITLLAEFIETGGIVPYISIYPFTVYGPVGYTGTYILICEVLFVVFTFASLVYVIFVLARQRWAALKNFWFMVDVFAVVTAVSTASMFHLRISSAKMAVANMKEDRMQFMNFHQVVLYDRGFVTCLGFLIAIAFFRLLKLAGYSERTMRVYHVLRLAVSILPSFFSYIFLLLLCFAFLGYSLFGKTSEHFQSFLASMMTLFTGILGHSGFKETNLPVSDKWETVFFFCFFLVICVMFLANLFMAILMDLLTLTAQKDCDAIKTDEAQIFSLLWESLLTKLRLNRKPINWVQTEDSLGKVKVEPQVNIDHYGQFDRLTHIANRLLDDQSGVTILRLVRFHEAQKQNTNISKENQKFDEATYFNIHRLI